MNNEFPWNPYLVIYLFWKRSYTAHEYEKKHVFCVNFLSFREFGTHIRHRYL